MRQLAGPPGGAQRQHREPCVERGNAEDDRQARYGTEIGVVDDLVERGHEVPPGADLLQPRRGYLQHPGRQKHEKHPDVVPAQPPRQRGAERDQEARRPQILAERARPARIDVSRGREHLREMIALDEPQRAR